MSGGQAGNKKQDRQTNGALNSRGEIKCGKEIKITAPLNEWWNIPFFFRFSTVTRALM